MFSSTAVSWQALVEALGLSLLHFLWQGLAIAVALRIVLELSRNAPAAFRYWVSVAGLAAMALAVPVTTLALLHAGGPSAGAASSLTAPIVVGTEPTVGTESTAASNTFGWLSAPYLIVALWLAGVLVVSLRLLFGWRTLQRLRRSARAEVSGMLEAVNRDMHRLLGLHRKVGIAISGAVRGPMLVGWLKPVILLPPAIVATLPRDQIEMIVAHELAHFRRRDHWINLFQVIVETLLFYHPAVAWTSRRIRVERENACDDLAIACTGRRLSYVEMLATLERNRLPGPALALGVQDGQIVARIRRLVERGEPRDQRGSVLPLLLLSGVLAAGIAVPLVDGQNRDETNDAFPAPADSGDSAEPAETATADAGRTLPAIQPPEPTRSTPRPAVAQPVAIDEGMPEEMPDTPVAIDAAQLAAPDAEQLLAAGNSIALPVQRTMLPSSLAPLPSPVAGNARAAAKELIAGGSLIERTDPRYPRKAMRREISGAVELELLVDESGRVSGVEIVQETPTEIGFAEAASTAARDWRFEPFTLDGRPIEHRVRIEFEFDPGTGCRNLTGSRIPRC